MPILLSVAGFLGAWLLVAGPIYQAAVELEDEAVDQVQVREVVQSVPQPPRMSPWWWLLPPVAFVKRQRVGRTYREAVTRALPPSTFEQWIHFNQKATGWLLVGAGGSLLALKETWELVEALEWRPWSFWPLTAGAFLLCALNTVLQTRRSHEALRDSKAGGDEGARQQDVSPSAGSGRP